MGKEAAILLFLGVFYLRISSLAVSHNRSSIDESSLLSLKAQINSEETSFCTWIWDICCRKHPKVAGLDLSNMDLQGIIAGEISNLSFLTFLSITNNNINGLIPGEIGNLRRLRVLDMVFNKFNDHLPQSLGFLKKLEVLNLSNNYLSEDIPRSLSACVQLSILDLSYNNLTGNIPIEFGNLSRLQGLSLKTNQLIGMFHDPQMLLISLELVQFEFHCFLKETRDKMYYVKIYVGL